MRSLSLAPLALAAALAGCTTATQPIAPRALERPEHLDYACLHLYDLDASGVLIPVRPSARPLAACGSPAKAGQSREATANRLVGFVSQGNRGEIAVVDLTGQSAVDVERGLPGVTALPVGENVRDVAASADGKLLFVASGDPSKPAIYAVPTEKILGPLDLATPESERLPIAVTSWPACALPEEPGAITIVPRPDRGEGEAGYDVVVALPGREGRDGSGKIVVLDPRPFARGAGLDASSGARVAPGSLAACPVVGAVSLDGAAPSSLPAAKTWGNGVDYAAVDASTVAPPASPTCSGPNPSGQASLAFAAGARPVAGQVVRVEGTLLVADESLPLVHVVDVSDPAAPVERSPLVLTRRQRTVRPFGVTALAVSPVTRRYTRTVYAVDGEDGSLAVFEIDANVGREVQVPMRRPSPELNPAQPVDRIAFASPVRTLAFARHDLPVDSTSSDNLVASATGLLCNPSPNALGAGGAYRDLGAAYRANDPNARAALGPARLRGVFGFAGLASGQVVVLDVEDWDAPCRRPDPLSASAGLAASPFAAPQPEPTGADDLDPYHVPFAYVSGSTTPGSPVTGEAVFPVSAPNRPRSRFLLRSDAAGGTRLPYLSQAPQLSDGAASLPTSGPNAEQSPALRPTAPDTGVADPAWVNGLTSIDPRAKSLDPLYAQASTWLPSGPAIGPRFSYEDPTTQADQDWFVVREGAIPGFGSTRGKLAAAAGGPAAASMTLTSLSGPLCERGIEDYRVGLARAREVQAQLRAAGLPPAQGLEQRLTDYVQLVGDVPSKGDPWWSAPDWEEGGTCADPAGPTADARYDFCSRLYGVGDAGLRNVQRDFPILEAYADRLVLGLFDTAGNPTASETSVPARFVARVEQDSSIWLQRARCCFAKQAAYRVRAGGAWLVTGSASGFLHHVRTRSSDGSCVLSCDVGDRLLNGRAIEIPRPAAGTSAAAPNRRSPLAFRNPAFAFVMWSGARASGRGWTWQFGTRGQYVPYTWDLRGSTTASASSVNVLLSEIVPVDPFGHVAVVDSGSRGITLFDLATMTVAAGPYL
jgi:hypothetical protein